MWPRPRQQVVEQNDIGGDLIDLIALGLERALCRRNQQADNKRGKCSDKPRA